MKNYRKIFGILVVVFLLVLGLQLPAFCGNGDAKTTYAWSIDKEIAKCEAKIELLKNTKSANLQLDAVKARTKLSFLKDYKKEIIAAMEKENVVTKDYYHVSNFLNAKFIKVFAGGHTAVGKCC